MAGKKSISLDKKTFTIILICMGVAIIAGLGAFILAKTGAFAAIGNLLTPAPEITDDENEVYIETGPWGSKTYSWIYNGKTFELNTYISKENYKQYDPAVTGKKTQDAIPDNLLNYVVTNDKDNTVKTVAQQISSFANKEGYNDKQRIELVVSFVQSLAYKTDAETGHTTFYPRYPVETLAEKTGDSGDLTILAMSILDALGYGSSLIYYYPAYDQLNLIPEAIALGIPGTDAETSPVYYAASTYKPQNVIIIPEKTSFYPMFGTASAENPGGDNAGYGWYFGEGMWTAGEYCGTLGNSWYYPDTGYFTAEKLPDIPDGCTDKITCTIKNAQWIVPVQTVWIADTAQKGYPKEAYNTKTPVILSGDMLWKGKAYKPAASTDYTLWDKVSGNEPTRIITPEADIKIATPHYDEGYTPAGWIYDSRKYYDTTTWYPSGISWTTNDKWQIYDRFLSINSAPANLYTPWGYAEKTTEVPWRIAYKVNSYKGYTYTTTNPTATKTATPTPVKSESTSGGSGFSPYSSVQIAVYKKIADGTYELTDITGWQGESGAELTGYSEKYSPGEYALGVFVRNTDVTISLQYYGKPDKTSYRGGI